MDFIAGCIGGCAGVVVGHPFDTIKVRLQTQDVRNPAYRSGLHCLQTIVKKESATGLYRGMSSPMAGVAVINAIVFGVQGNLQRRLPNPESLSSHFVSGTAAGVAQSLFCSPMELVKTRMQIQEQNLYRSPWECLRNLFRAEGTRGVFRGLGITALREGPGFGIYFLVYEFLTRNDTNKPISTSHMLLAGGTAGSASWLFAYPIDVIKTRLQVDGMIGPKIYKNSYDCLVKSVRNEGWTCLTKGLTLTLVRGFPVNAATWAAVSWIIRLSEENKAKHSGYIKLSELTNAAFHLPELNRSFQPASQSRFRDKESLGRRLPMTACGEHTSRFELVLNSLARA